MIEGWKVYIRGVEGRGKEVIKTLTDLGAKNNEELRDNYVSCYYIYFINHKGNISSASLNSEPAKIIMDNYNEIKLNGKWKPKENEIYWYIDLDGTISNDLFDIFDNNIYNFGNCFKTKEEAETMAEKIKELLNAEL